MANFVKSNYAHFMLGVLFTTIFYTYFVHTLAREVQQAKLYLISASRNNPQFWIANGDVGAHSSASEFETDLAWVGKNLISLDNSIDGILIISFVLIIISVLYLFVYKYKTRE